MDNKVKLYIVAFLVTMFSSIINNIVYYLLSGEFAPLMLSILLIWYVEIPVLLILQFDGYDYKVQTIILIVCIALFLEILPLMNNLWADVISKFINRAEIAEQINFV